jgi:hypothetical protein
VEILENTLEYQKKEEAVNARKCYCNEAGRLATIKGESS